jgi:hypothetical protein
VAPVADVTSSMWTKDSSLIRLQGAETNLSTAMAAVVKESDFIYGKENGCLFSTVMRLCITE